MNKKLRIFLALLLLAVSLALLIWAFGPTPIESRSVPILPGDLQLPTPEAFFWGVI